MALALAQVGCLTEGEAPDETPAVAEAKVNALSSGVLHMEHCTQTDQDQLKTFGVYASEWLNLGTGVRIVGGNVGIRDSEEPSGTLGFQLKLGQNARIDLAKTTTANFVLLQTGSKVGALKTNIGELVRQGTATHGALSDFPESTPIPPQVAPVTVPDVASKDITVMMNATPPAVSAGDYRIVTVQSGGTLELSGGNYKFRSLTLEDNARLVVGATTVITVNELITTGIGARIAPNSPPPGQTAKDLTIRAAAGYQGSDMDGEIPAIDFGEGTVVRALIIAPQAHVRFQDYARLRGALVTRSALWTVGNPDSADPASVIYEDGIVGEVCEPYDCSTIVDDNNACTVDTCTPEWGQQHDPATDGTTCTAADNQEGACIAGTCEELCNEQAQSIKGNPRIEYMATPAPNPTPAGKWLVRYVSGCMKYNPLWWWSVNGTENGEYAWFLVEADKRQILPGTFGFFNSTTPPPGTKSGFKNFEDCVQANLELATPQVIDHAGNDRMRIYLADHPYTDNRHGLLGQNPTWSITPFECGAQ